MKIVLFIFMIVLVYSCDEKTLCEADGDSVASSNCFELNKEYENYIYENCSECSINKNYGSVCEEKYPNSDNMCNTFTAYGKPKDCFSLSEKYLTVDLMKSYSGKNIEEEIPLCKAGFSKNQKDRCLNMNEFFIQELKFKCFENENIETLITTHREFSQNICSAITIKDDDYIYLNGFCVSGIQNATCDDLISFVGKDLRTIQSFNCQYYIGLD